jgi:D-alanyl-lipoteichoic acid acyltransferase DltB (MBOAT superfamily)
MLFNSVEYLWFFPLVVGLYFAVSPRYRWILLLAASYYFYMSWRVAYIVLILTSALVDYLAARLMEGQEKHFLRKALLVGNLATNLAILFSPCMSPFSRNWWPGPSKEPTASCRSSRGSKHSTPIGSSGD